MYKYKSRWEACGRKLDYFLIKNDEWLNENIYITVNAHQITPRYFKGRRQLEFEESSERSKRRKTEDLRETKNVLELAYATHMSLRAQGNIDAATVVKDAVFSTPKRAQTIRKAYKDSMLKTQPFSNEKALSILVDAKLTKFQYNIIRLAAKEQNCKLFPAYENITEAKKLCLPENINVTETTAEVKLQSLLDHTIKRIAQVQCEVLNTTLDDLDNIVLISKWGCDGSSGQSQYKQVFTSDGSTDEHIFLTSMVPIQLKTNKNKILWQNPRTSSSRFCRPIRLQFIKEDVNYTKLEMAFVENQIKTLVPTSIIINNKIVNVEHKLLFTMVDGKVCNAITNTKSAQRCYLCGATSKEFNNIEVLLKKDN